MDTFIKMRGTVLISFLTVASVASWSNIPKIPSNRRSQYYLREADGAYEYGYDSGDGTAAKQKATSENQVEGFYTFQNADGRKGHVKYSAGVQGFVPEAIFQQENSNSRQKVESNPILWEVQPQHAEIPAEKILDTLRPVATLRAPIQVYDNSDASYHQLSYNTGEHARKEKSGASANVQGLFSYDDEAGEQDLKYTAGRPEMNFQANEKFLVNPLGEESPARKNSWKSQNDHSQPDKLFSFSYDTDDHARIESSGGFGNTRGKYPHSGDAGNQDLSYSAGDSRTFPEGESFSVPNGLVSKSFNANNQDTIWKQPLGSHSVQNDDGTSYDLTFSTDSQARQESPDAFERFRENFAVHADGEQQQLQFESNQRGFVTEEDNLRSSWEPSETFFSNAGITSRGSFNPQFRPLQFPHDHRPYSMEKSVHPTFTLITPASNQMSFEYGVKNAIILGFLPPKHSERHGYIYDTLN